MTTTITRNCYGMTPYIVGCEQKEVLLSAGLAVEVIDNNALRSVTVRTPGTKVGCYWTLVVDRDCTTQEAR